MCGEARRLLGGEHEAAVERTLIPFADVPFLVADHGGEVSGVAQGFGERGLVLGDRNTTGEIVFSKALGVAAHHESGAARAAWGVVGVAVVETDAHVGEAVDILGAGIGTAEGSDIATGEVIDVEEDDVGSVRCGGGCDGDEGEQRADAGCQEFALG